MVDKTEYTEIIIFLLDTYPFTNYKMMDPKTVNDFMLSVESATQAFVENDALKKIDEKILAGAVFHVVYRKFLPETEYRKGYKPFFPSVNKISARLGVSSETMNVYVNIIKNLEFNIKLVEHQPRKLKRSRVKKKITREDVIGCQSGQERKKLANEMYVQIIDSIVFDLVRELIPTDLEYSFFVQYEEVRNRYFTMIGFVGRSRIMLAYSLFLITCYTTKTDIHSYDLSAIAGKLDGSKYFNKDVPMSRTATTIQSYHYDTCREIGIREKLDVDGSILEYISKIIEQLGLNDDIKNYAIKIIFRLSEIKELHLASRTAVIAGVCIYYATRKFGRKDITQDVISSIIGWSRVTLWKGIKEIRPYKSIIMSLE